MSNGTITGTSIRNGRIRAMLEYDFMRSAFAAATIVAVVSGTVGYFLVLRGQTFAGHALSHVGFTRVVFKALLYRLPEQLLLCGEQRFGW
jgi:zinc/manganese transport system permease protein